MADTSEDTPSTASNTSEESTKWQPYWDDNYKRYYWSDGNESVWETPPGCIEPPPPTNKNSSTADTENQQYSTSNYALSMAYATTAQSDVRYQPYAIPPAVPNMINTGKRLVGQDARDLRQLYHYFDYNAWNEELNRTNANQKKKVKLTKKELDAIKARRAAIKRKHRDKWLLED